MEKVSKLNLLFSVFEKNRKKKQLFFDSIKNGDFFPADVKQPGLDFKIWCRCETANFGSFIYTEFYIGFSSLTWSIFCHSRTG